MLSSLFKGLSGATSLPAVRQSHGGDGATAFQGRGIYGLLGCSCPCCKVGTSRVAHFAKLFDLFHKILYFHYVLSVAK